jgi:hypothetical protein
MLALTTDVTRFGRAVARARTAAAGKAPAITANGQPARSTPQALATLLTTARRRELVQRPKFPADLAHALGPHHGSLDRGSRPHAVRRYAAEPRSLTVAATAVQADMGCPAPAKRWVGLA